jgi:hypothetical protein
MFLPVSFVCYDFRGRLQLAFSITDKRNGPMNLRKITSLTAFLSFIILLLTSIVLYVVPEGRVAYWSDWKWMGLSKSQWGALHINFGFLFILAGIIHIYLNWKPILQYLKDRAKKIKIFTASFNIALVLTVLCAFGTYFTLPPFSWVLSIGEAFKDAGSKTYGEPPYGHAELSSLKLLCNRLGLDVEASLKGLQDANIQFQSETQTILEIAQINGLTPKDVYEAMLPKMDETSVLKMPEFPEPKVGKQTLSEVCTTYGLDISAVINGLAQNGIEAKPEMTFKEVADGSGMSAPDLYSIIYDLVNP